MRLEQLQAQRGYDRRPRHHAGKSANFAPNHLQQAFTVDAPNKVWVTDITYIRTHEGWLYLAAVMDLFSRQIVGWSMGARMETELVLNALLMEVWRRRPTAAVMIHSDQGSQFSSHDWQAFVKVHNLVPSMSRRGNCWDTQFIMLTEHRTDLIRAGIGQAAFALTCRSVPMFPEHCRAYSL